MSITLGSETLPNPSEEDIELEIIGSSYMLANGNIQHDNIDTDPIRNFTLTWRAVSELKMIDIVDAWKSLFTANRAYTDILGDSYTVTATQGRDRIKVTTVARNTPVYNVTIKLREVL